jgi:hypothetical protein
MNKFLSALFFLTIFIQISLAQNWKFMVETSLQITQRENKTYQLNDSTQVEIRDFGIDEFTIFTISSAKKTYFIHKNICKGETYISGGVDRKDSYYYLVDFNFVDGTWVAYRPEHALQCAFSWSLFTKRKIRQVKRRCR